MMEVQYICSVLFGYLDWLPLVESKADGGDPYIFLV